METMMDAFICIPKFATFGQLDVSCGTHIHLSNGYVYVLVIDTWMICIVYSDILRWVKLVHGRIAGCIAFGQNR